MPEIPTFLDDDVLRIGAIEFQCAFPLRNATGGRVPVMKERELVERYIERSQNLEPAVMVELGINRGGSTALLSELNHPDTLIAVEINTTPAPVLQEYIAEHGLTDAVRPFYGVDQSDRARVSEILAQELGGRPIDLVVDDASHLYDETLSSFETLFPHLRPDGLFVIEDWCFDHRLADGLADATNPDRESQLQQFQAALEAVEQEAWSRPPLTRLAMELVVARASTGDVIREVTINGDWVVARRGADALHPEGFRLSDHVNDHFGFITTR